MKLNQRSLNFARFARAALVSTMLAGLTACLPTNNFTTPVQSTTNTGLDGSAGAGLGSTASTDNAQPPCTQFDPSTPTRAICVSCFQSILSTRCPGKTAFASCIDPTVVSGYVNLINNCIAQSTQAGFVCSATCSAGQVINTQSCTCVAPTNSPTGSGSQNIDVGQTDFGPPIVGATFPDSSIVGTPAPSPTPGLVQPTSCVGAIPLYLSVQNRGDTVFRLNQYGPAQPSPHPALNGLGTPYISGASQPVALTTTEIADHPGTNAYSLVNFLTAGLNEILGVTAITGGRVGNINTVSGANSAGPSFADGVNTTVNQFGSQAYLGTWSSAGYGARDVDGNVYFSDPNAHVVDVICYNPWVSTGVSGCSGGACPYTGNSPFCKDQPVGTMVRVAGQAGQAGKPDEGQPAWKPATKLNSPHGLAVDLNYNVYIADSGNNAVEIVCGNNGQGGTAASGRCNNGATTLNIYTLVGGPAFGKLNYPYGLDVTTDAPGADVDIYIAEFQGNRISAYCEFGDGFFCAGGGPTLTTLLGLGNPGDSGSPGYMPDGSQNSFTGSPSLRYPTDVKINGNGNIVYSDSHNDLIRAFCLNSTDNDFCMSSTKAVITIAGIPPMVGGKPDPNGIPVASFAGEGAPANLAGVTNPRQLLLGKRYADDDGGGGANSFVNFADNNIIFTEGLLGGTIQNGFSAPTPILNAASKGGGPVTNISQLAMGNWHACMINSSGVFSCVGENTTGVGQLGDPSITGASTPHILTTVLSGLTGTSPSTLGAGTFNTCVSTGNPGGMQCWGQNAQGQDGIGGPTAVLSPQSVLSGQGSGAQPAPSGPKTPRWSNIVGGDDFTCAVDNTDGDTVVDTSVNPQVHHGKTVYCWGDNGSGQLGTGDPSSPAYPALRVSWTGFGSDLSNKSTIQIAAGQNHVCFDYFDGGGSHIVGCWGNNGLGQLGQDPSSTSQQTRPGGVTGQGPAFASGNGHPWAVAAGGNHTCAWDTSTGGAGHGDLWCWGSDASGELGDGTVNPTGTTGAVEITSVTVHGSTDGNLTTNPVGPITPYWAAVALGYQHTCAITGVGSSTTAPTVMCWGDNTYGQLGTDEVTSSAFPIGVVGLPIGTISGIYAGPGGSGDAGSNSTCAIINVNGGSGAGTPYCWGQNDKNQIGIGPVSAIPLGNTVRVVCGHNIGITAGQGFCDNSPQPTYTELPTPHQGSIYTLAGVAGLSGTGGAGDGSNARAAVFSKVGGLTFDGFKNLVVSDGGYTSNTGTVYNGFRLRLISNDVIGPESGIKYSVTDSNGESSYWCLRLKPMTYCDSEGNCLCAMVPPTDDPDPNFWEAVASQLYCN